MERLNIRRASSKDFEEILKLANVLYETERPFDSNIKQGYYETSEGKQKLLKAIRARNKTFLVAEMYNKIVGFCDGYMIEDNVYIDKIAYLDRLCVDEIYRKIGIGSRLIETFSNIFKEKGAKYIKLNAFGNNMPAVNLYKDEGFYEYSIYYMKQI